MIVLATLLSVVIGGALPPWTEGTLDIHQIDTGRGNSALFVERPEWTFEQPVEVRHPAGWLSPVRWTFRTSLLAGRAGF